MLEAGYKLYHTGSKLIEFGSKWIKCTTELVELLLVAKSILDLAKAVKIAVNAPRLIRISSTLRVDISRFWMISQRINRIEIFMAESIKIQQTISIQNMGRAIKNWYDLLIGGEQLFFDIIHKIINMCN